jgi:hypothetical protein
VARVLAIDGVSVPLPIALLVVPSDVNTAILVKSSDERRVGSITPSVADRWS